jgi:hypothetical protein
MQVLFLYKRMVDSRWTHMLRTTDSHRGLLYSAQRRLANAFIASLTRTVSGPLPLMESYARPEWYRDGNRDNAAADWLDDDLGTAGLPVSYRDAIHAASILTSNRNMHHSTQGTPKLMSIAGQSLAECHVSIAGALSVSPTQIDRKQQQLIPAQFKEKLDQSLILRLLDLRDENTLGLLGTWASMHHAQKLATATGSDDKRDKRNKRGEDQAAAAVARPRQDHSFPTDYKDIPSLSNAGKRAKEHRTLQQALVAGTQLVKSNEILRSARDNERSITVEMLQSENACALDPTHPTCQALSPEAQITLLLLRSRPAAMHDRLNDLPTPNVQSRINVNNPLDRRNEKGSNGSHSQRTHMQNDLHNTAAHALAHAYNTTGNGTVRLELCEASVQSKDEHDEPNSKLRRTDLAHSLGRHTSHADVTFFQAQAKGFLNRSCNGVAAYYDKHRNDRTACPFTALSPLHNQIHTECNKKAVNKQEKYRDIPNNGDNADGIISTFHAVVSTVNGTLHQSVVDYVNHVVSVDKDNRWHDRAEYILGQLRNAILTHVGIRHYRRLKKREAVKHFVRMA